MNAIYRWDPFRGLNTLQEQVNRLLGESFAPSGETTMATWAPAVDIYETENELVVKADLPGREREGHRRARREQLAHDSAASVSLRSPSPRKTTCASSAPTARFTRSFSLPNTVNTEAIGAEYKNGVLTVTCRSARSPSRGR